MSIERMIPQNVFVHVKYRETLGAHWSFVLYIIMKLHIQYVYLMIIKNIVNVQ